MEKIKLRVYAKINLSLNILGRKDDLHELDTIMASVDIADVISVCKRADSKINIIFDSPLVPKNNTVTRAISLLKQACEMPFGADIFIQKSIPFSAGLGGSSADAAGVLFALDKLFNFSFCGVNMPLTALKVGSDVPYMQMGGFVRVLGTGERLQKIDSNAEFFCVILKDKAGVSTARAYASFDDIYLDFRHCPSDNCAIVSLLEQGKKEEAASHFGNALTSPSIKIEPSIKNTLLLLEQHGAYSQFMSGSGSACVGLFYDKPSADRAAQSLLKRGLYAKSLVTKKSGIEIIQ